MTATPPALNDREFMKALLNLMIPPSASRELPGAGTLGLESAVASGLQTDPLLGPMVEAGVQAVREAALSEHPDGLPGMPPQAAAKLLRGQLASHPFLIVGMSRHLFPAYYQHPQVLKGIGEPPRPPFPEGFDVEPTNPKLLEKLMARRKTSSDEVAP